MWIQIFLYNKEAKRQAEVEQNEEGEIDREYLNDEGTKFAITDGTKRLIIETFESKGSHENYLIGPFLTPAL